MLSNIISYDLVVIGGGINGAGIAADAAGRGLSVLLCEKNDLGSGTSSQSSKLIHGGLRYLEHCEFRLVKEALAEREILLNIAPHIIKPLCFILPHRPHLRPAWMIRVGLFIYDLLSKRQQLASSKWVSFDQTNPLKEHITHGFKYWDAKVDVILNAMSAAEQGATILPHTKCISAKRSGNHWFINLQDQENNTQQIVKAKALVNATGPWVNNLFEQALELKSPKKIRLVKGSHIIVPRLHLQPQAYILQTEDQRIVFVIPYLEKFSLIGTTDVEYIGDPSDAKITNQEIDYLLAIANGHFKQQISADDIISSFSGVRPLVAADSGAAHDNSRDYCIEIDQLNSRAPLISVFGGKITTYRKLSQDVVTMVCDALTKKRVTTTPSWTSRRRLPGGDFDSLSSLNQMITNKYRWLAPETINRYANTYGSYTMKLLGDINCQQQMGQHFGADLYQCEVEYLQKNEWATCCNDILWRRTKLGLAISKEQAQRLCDFMEHQESHTKQVS
ncbi:MAG: glycerol-3-phosphate dehydrogenase [Gammaproteobacteria bacterium]|nr:glycerol-3-phosphate dehydrogenase [Gammaproteobacteria bacterium]